MHKEYFMPVGALWVDVPHKLFYAWSLSHISPHMRRWQNKGKTVPFRLELFFYSPPPVLPA